MNLYETITNRIIASLEAGVIPWRKEWKASARGTTLILLATLEMDLAALDSQMVAGEISPAEYLRISHMLDERLEEAANNE